MLVKDLLMECFVNEESELAHYLYHLLKEKKISFNDDIHDIDLNQADHQLVAEMVRKNVLGFHMIRIYSLRMNQKEVVFIYAGSTLEAIDFFMDRFLQPPLNCHEIPLNFHFEGDKGVLPFREMQKEFGSFPAIAGYFIK